MRSRRLLKLATAIVFGLGLLYLAYSKVAPEWQSSALSGSAVPASAIVSLVKQRERAQVIQMVRNVEDRFNNRFHYDWVFLSEEDFLPDFERAVSAFTSGTTYFRTVNRKQHWKMPSDIDRNRLMNTMRNLETQGVPYAGSATYRLMCRFLSGFFMEYLPEYRYYWRIDPDVKLFCDINEDIFATMHEGQKKLGFSISLREVPHAAEDLSKAANQFMKMHKSELHPNQWMDSWMQPWDACCHFWSNFEVGDLDFFRSEKYKMLFEHFEKTGGFFYNRWGDAPFHALAASLFLDPSEVHWFGQIGSYHKPLVSCPTSLDERLKLRCTCPDDPTIPQAEQNAIFTFSKNSCTPQFLNLSGEAFPAEWEKWAELTVAQKYGGEESSKLQRL